jgi:hypothetical protein
MPGVKQLHFVIFAIIQNAASFFRFINVDKASTFDPDFI